MGFFKKIGKGIKKATRTVTRAASNVVRTVTPIASKIVSKVPIVGPLAGGIIRTAGTVAADILRKQRNQTILGVPQPSGPVPATAPTGPFPDGTIGDGADLYKFSKSEDKWKKVLGTPKKVTVDGVEYDWKTTRGISYYAKPIPLPPTPIGNTAGVGVQSGRPLTKEDTQISFEQLISGLHFYYEESNFRSGSRKYNGINNYAFLAYLAARELFGTETPIIEGRGTTKKLRQWEAKIKLVSPKQKEDDIIRVLNIIGEDILAGGTGYLNTQTKVNGLRGGFYGSNRNAKNFREDIETKTGPINNGNILINYDDLLTNISRMDARNEFIMTRMTSVRNVLRKAWTDWRGGSFSQEKDRTIAQWKRDIDRVTNNNGISKRRQFGAFSFNNTANNNFGNSGSTNPVYDETWMDLMILLNASARAERKTGNSLVTNQYGKQ